MKKIYLLFSLVLVLATAVPTQAFEQYSASSGDDFVKVGAAGAQFLKIGIGGRGNGMAGACAASANDLSSLYWNPAGLAEVDGISAEFGYNTWYAGFSHNFAAISYALGGSFTFGLHFISLSSGRIQASTLETQDVGGGSYEVSDVVIGGTLAGFLTEQFSFGITAKYVTNSFASLESSGVAFDIGTKYQTDIQGIVFGFSMMNLGSDMKYQGADLNTVKNEWEGLFRMPMDAQYQSSAYNMPLIFRAGIKADIFEMDESKMIAEVDFNTLSDSPEQFILGVEYSWNDLLFLRGGYMYGNDQTDMAFGLGVNYDGTGFGGRFDYSLTPATDLGLVHRITLAVALD